MTVEPTFREALRFWLKLGCVSFGGPVGQIAVMHAELVGRKKWISGEAFARALNFCMLLPGPEATQLAVYCGWRLHGVRGGLAAGALFVLPAALLMWALSWAYVSQEGVVWVGAVFHGLKPAVVAIVAAAVWRMGRGSLRRMADWMIAGLAFAAMIGLRAPFPAVVAGAALSGFFLGGRTSIGEEREGGDQVMREAGRARAAWRAAMVLVVAWWLPVALAAFWQGRGGLLVREGMFFSQTAMVTFGGAYAVLPHVAQNAVEQQGWLTAPQMLDGLGLAETTPGPLIMVVQFVGFLGGWNQPGELPPLVMATLGAAMTTWTTFLPSFVWIFLGAPHLERLGAWGRLNGALAAVTAAVTGVVLNLAVWLAVQALSRPGTLGGGIDWFAVGVAVVALFALPRFGVVVVVLASGLAGLAWG